MMRVLVCGGRDFGYLHRMPDGKFEPEGEKQYLFGKAWLIKRFGEYLMDHDPAPVGDLTIISGEAPGADTIATDFAMVYWTGYKGFPADWAKYGKRAGFMRNVQMLEEGKPDLVIAFPGGKGTAMMVDLANRAGVPVEEVVYE